MRFLNLSVDDYANMSHENANALRSVGVYVDDFCINKHVFNYATQSKQIHRDRIKDVVGNYDCVQIFHSDERLLKHVLDGKPKKIVVYHSGTRYRQNHEYYNELFKDYKQLTDQTEFIKLGNMSYIAPHTSLTSQPKRQDGKLIIGHYPSNPSVKGTDGIEYVLNQFKYDFEIRIDRTKVSHDQQLKRMSECHVYVELFAPEQQGKQYGCFGVTAFEATGLGCHVITQNLNPKVYEDVYGACYFSLANDKENFYRILEELKDVDRNMLLTPAGFYINHNIESTGYKILELTK